MGVDRQIEKETDWRQRPGQMAGIVTLVSKDENVHQGTVGNLFLQRVR